MGAQAECVIGVDPDGMAVSPAGHEDRDQRVGRSLPTSRAQATDQSAKGSDHRPPTRGRSFNLGNIVQAARRSFERGTEDNAVPPTMQRYYTQALWLDHQSGMHVAHAPPPGMDEPPIPPESEEDEHEYVEHVDVKAVSLEGLREFVKKHNIGPGMSTRQVVKSIIVPATLGCRGAFIDTPSMARHVLPPLDSPGAAAARKAAGPPPTYTRLPKKRPLTGLKRRAPYYYVVHAWSRPFLELVAMLEEYFAGRPAEHTFVWLDVFAVPQVSPEHGTFIPEIQRAIWYATNTVACCDPSGTILTRLWCLYEMFYTIVSKQCAHALVCVTSVPLTAQQRVLLYRKIDAHKARCSLQADKDKIAEHVLGYTRRGFAAVNNYIRSGLMLPPHHHPAIYLPKAEFEKRKGVLGLVPCLGPPPPPPQPPIPDHIASVPAEAQPSVRKGQAFARVDGMPMYERPLRLVMGACNIPHPSKTKTGGEDAFFLSGAGRGAMGVADGVGSWSSEDGIDPALYSRDLMRATASSLEASGGRIGARMALADAHMTVKHAGSSTALVAALPPDSNCLQVINMGDSGLRLIRDNTMGMATRPQAHAHNMPYQLACPDEPLCDTDSTVQGDRYTVPLEAGDVLILATDGLYDNVWPDDIIDIVNRATGPIQEFLEREINSRRSLPSSNAGEQGHGSSGGRGSPRAGAQPTSGDDGETATTTITSGEVSPETTITSTTTTTTTNASTSAAKADGSDDKIGRHAPIAGDAGEAVRADASSHPVPPGVTCARAAALARTLARTAASNMLRRDVRTPFAVELSKQPNATQAFRGNPRGGKPDDVTVVVAVVVEADEDFMVALEGAHALSLQSDSLRLATARMSQA